MNIRHLLSASFFSSFFIVCSCANSSYAASRLQFTVDLRNTKSHTVHVSVTPMGFHAPVAVYQMPVWAPGAYSVSHYGKYVVNFKAYNKNADLLDVKQLNDDRWQIEQGKSVARIEYDVLDSHLDTTSLYFAMANMDTSLFFANGTALFGYFDDDKKAGADVSYMIPNDWKLVCALPAPGGYSQDTNSTFKNTMFVAKDYDELVDAPVLAAAEHKDENHLDHIVTKSFLQNGIVYDIAVATDGSWSDSKMDSLTENLRQIIHAETDFFHDTPYKHYTFEIVAPTLSHLPGLGQGALEHANSSDYLLIDFGWSMFKGYFLSTFSHEFFHLWNVKRIHSNLLGPFDYTQRVMTTSLWMAEGITEYYAHTLLSRYGIISPERFFADFQQWRGGMDGSTGPAKLKSLEDLSIDESTFEMDEATQFYLRGPVVALMLDVEIRSRTNNKKSLDDVMLALNNDAKHGKTFREEDLIHKVEQYAGIDLTDFYNKYIHGNDSLPIDAYLAKMGYAHAAEAPAQQTQLAVISDTLFFFQSLDSTGPLATSGVKQGDVLLAINGTQISLSNMAMLSSMDSLNGSTMTVRREGQSLDIHILDSRKKKDADAGSGIDPSATPMATAIRKGIVGQ